MKIKIILSVIMLGCFSAFAQDNPYEIYGHKTNVVYVDRNLFTLISKDSNSITKKIVYDAEKRMLFLYDNDNKILHTFNVVPNKQFIWLSVDPATKKYPSMSPYSAFGGSPILITDKKGDILTIGNEKSDLSLADMQSLVPKEYQGMIKVVNKNTIIFEGYDNLPENIKNYEGVSLLNNMITSQKVYKYTAGNTIKVRDSGTNQSGIVVYDPTGPKANVADLAIQNYSITPKWAEEKGDESYKPEEGVDGSVRIPQGDFSVENQFTNTTMKVDRPVLVFHELKENFLRTETTQKQITGYSYAPNGGMYYSNSESTTTGGAHEASGNLGKTNARQLGLKVNGASGTAQNWKFTPTTNQ